MPIDPSIPLSVKPAQFQSPLEALQPVLQLQALREQTEARRLAADEARQKAKDQAAIRQVFTETGGDVEAALPRLRMIAPGAALELETELHKGRKERFDALAAQTTHQGKQLDLGLKIAQSVTDDRTYQIARPTLLALSPDLAPLLPETYDPTRWRSLLDIGLSAKEISDRKTDALKLFTEGKATEAVGTWLSTAKTPQEWDGIVAGAKELGVPAALLTQFGAYSPENVQRAAAVTITPAKKLELAGQAETRAQTASHQGVIEAQGAQRVAIARQRLAQGTGTDRDRTDLMQAVIDNPGLWDQITPTERGKIAGDLNARGFTGFGKPLSDAAVKQISESNSAIASLKDLREVLKANEQYIGPLAGLQALNPYSDARKAQADIDRVRQRVGKALEGGVLRKEDEEKYKKILATLRDEPSTALYKVDRLMADIQRDVDTYTHQQRLAGRRVPQAAAPGKDPLGIR